MNQSCARCGGAATYIVKELGEETALCAVCVDRLNPSMSLAAMRKALSRARKPDNRCPHCGWTRAQLDQTGLLGCPLCYEALDTPVPV